MDELPPADPSQPELLGHGCDIQPLLTIELIHVGACRGEGVREG
jgi:hypothetical protein